ncbi:MAG: ATP-dependent helicase [bacterium]|nr:ATP-dependent helicase [bacterium]
MKKYVLKKKTAAVKNYTIDYKEELNPQQYKAVTNIEGPQLVIAGAGSGKTRTLIFRVAYLVENNIDPHSILLLTFTRKSAQEMMKRAAMVLDERCRRVAGGTFHSFGNLLLRKYALTIGMVPNFTIVDRSDAEDILQIIRTQLELNKKDRRFPKKGTLMNIISKAINKCAPLEEIVFEDYPQFEDDCEDIYKVAKLYQEFKFQKQVMDYDDLLVRLRDLLKNSEETRKTVSNAYKYIMVDEYQDTNRLQAEIALLLASEHSNILAVGDDSQSIYSFRGANFRNIMDFPQLFPGTEITTLEQNYRSTQPILALTNAIIENASEKYSKTLFSEIEGTEKPAFIDAVDEEEQSIFIAQRVLELREEGISLDRIAVLFRAGWHSNELELELKNKNIPYVKYGGIKFADAAHVKDTMAYLRVLYNVFDEIAWLRILLLLEGIGPATASKIIAKVLEGGGEFAGLIAPEFAKKKYYSRLQDLHSLLSRLSGSIMSPTLQLEAISEYYQPIFELRYDDYRRRARDLDSLLRISERYPALQQMLTDMALEPPDTSQLDVDGTDKENEQLVLSTIHSSKGLEWHTVFVIHLVEGFFPSSYAVESEEQLEEERRLFYVAATRAERNLYLLSPELESKRWSSFSEPGMIFSQPSQFIEEIHNFEDLTETWALDFEDEDPF